MHSDLIDKNGLLGGNEASYLLSQNRFLFRKKSINSMTGSIYTFGVGNHFFYIRMMTNPAIRLGDISTYMKKCILYMD
ncbi:hypothetical protein GS16_03185 [Candidatus Liberibacter solanacearum]|nr:hypothetical protein GS16_03185 [Candidatus Liberibacter solanacearum]KJZ80711.1 hypothetical protein KP07_02255 [Candidatus Liberibacter solanacearum]KQC48857.1 hypothetical protein AP064_04525 [Candidatus Liberibacter solanacearum]